MSKINISAGKLRGITRLADSSGRFNMMAIDQRSSLLRTLAAKFSGKSEKDVTEEEIAKVKYEHLAEVKEIITQVLSPYSTATLMDPQYGYPYSMENIPIGKVRKFLISKGVDNFKRANEKAKNALPWFEHKNFKGLANVVVAKQSPSWYKDF
jgi:tagatose-1,6-bisphosphate aldolase